MLDHMKSLSVGIVRYTRNLDFSLDMEMVFKGKAGILDYKDGVEEMEDDVNGGANANTNKNLDVKSRWMPFAQLKHGTSLALRRITCRRFETISS